MFVRGRNFTSRMKVKVLKRNAADFVRETKHDIHKINRNYRY